MADSRRRHPILTRVQHRAPALVVLLALVLVATLGWTVRSAIDHNRKLTVAGAETSARNLAHAFEGHVVRTTADIDRTLLVLRHALGQGQDAFKAQVELLREIYRDQLILQIALIGPDGRLISSTADNSAQSVDLSDREHFRIHRDRSEDQLFISKPVLGRVSGVHTLQFTRRLTAPGGGFGGVLVASVDPDFFARFFRTIDIGERGSITLVGIDGVIRARESRASGAGDGLGKKVPLDRTYLGEERTGVFRNVSVVDGVPRITAYRRLDQYPLVVLVGLAEDDVLQPYFSWRRNLTIWTVALSLPLLLAAVALARSLELQQRYRASLLRDAAELEAANVELSRQKAELRVANQRLRLLNHISLLPGGPGDKLARALTLGAKHLGLELGFVSRIEDGQCLIEHCVYPSGNRLAQGDSFDLARTYSALTLAFGDVLAIGSADMAAHPNLPRDPAFEFSAYIGVPLLVQDTPYGSLSFGSAPPAHQEFDDGDREFMRLLGRWAGSLLNEAHTNAELRRLATTDPLTGASNRRAFVEAAQRELERARRYRRPWVVLSLDIDHFKRVNDNYGHQAGDQALVAMADACRRTLRETDLFGRLGGEEFAALLPETDLPSALDVAQRLRQAVEALRLDYDGREIRITVSLGAAQGREDDTLEAVLSRADRALYQAKAQGRNRVVSAEQAAADSA